MFLPSSVLCLNVVCNRWLFTVGHVTGNPSFAVHVPEHIHSPRAESRHFITHGRLRKYDFSCGAGGGWPGARCPVRRVSQHSSTKLDQLTCECRALDAAQRETSCRNVLTHAQLDPPPWRLELGHQIARRALTRLDKLDGVA